MRFGLIRPPESKGPQTPPPLLFHRNIPGGAGAGSPASRGANQLNPINRKLLEAADQGRSDSACLRWAPRRAMARLQPLHPDLQGRFVQAPVMPRFRDGIDSGARAAPFAGTDTRPIPAASQSGDECRRPLADLSRRHSRPIQCRSQTEPIGSGLLIGFHRIGTDATDRQQTRLFRQNRP